METSQDDSEFRGRDGPLVLECGPSANLLLTTFFEAAKQAGHTFTTDVNGYRQEGFGPFDRNIRHGRRYGPRVPTSTRSWAGRTSRSERARGYTGSCSTGYAQSEWSTPMAANTAAPSSAATVRRQCRRRTQETRHRRCR